MTTPVRLILAFLTALLVGIVLSATGLAAQAPREPDTAVLAGGTLGPVTLDHKKHTRTHGAACETCHHPSKPQKALKAPHQKCADCHTKGATPPMVTKRQAAFHNATAKKGTCIDCHAQAAAKGAKVPVKCADCHRKA